MTDLVLVRRIEDSQLSVWPGVCTSIDGSWIVRLAGGHTNRANSLNILDPDDDADAAIRFEWVKGIYRRAGLPLVVRVTPLTPTPIVALADAGDFERFGETLMLVHHVPVELMDASVESNAVEITAAPTDAFINAVAAFSGYSDTGTNAYRAILDAIADDTRYVMVRDETGKAVCCLIAALHRDVATVFSLITDPAERRKGYARTAMAAAFDWAAGAGARLFWIGVEAGNPGALALYRSHGFEEIYRYHYRRQSEGSK